MQKKMHNEMETGIALGFTGLIELVQGLKGLDGDMGFPDSRFTQVIQDSRYCT